MTTSEQQAVPVEQEDREAADKAFDLAFRGDTNGIDDAMAQLFADHRALPCKSGEGAERYRHVKRGTVYEVVGRAQLQIATGDVCEGSELVIYHGEDGKLWARESGEFNDGRFEALSTPSEQFAKSSPDAEIPS